MKKLTVEQFARARDFLRSSARPLEKAIFELEFESGSLNSVLPELQKFQNPDGGFGQALEPDLRTPTSSALCTEIGLRHLAEWGVAAEHPMVQAAVQYLLAACDTHTQVWRVVPLDANDYAHAPWWHEEKGSLARTFDHFLLTPRAGILGALWHYAAEVPEAWLRQVTEETVAAVEQTDNSQFGSGGDAFLYALRLAESPELPGAFKSRLEPRLREAANAIVTRDPAKWSSYCIPPSKIAPAPKSLAAGVLVEDVQIYLDYAIEQQASAGSWEPTWSWFGNYPEQWIQAKAEWCGILTLETLLVFQAFGRIER